MYAIRSYYAFLPATDDLQDDLDAAQQDFRAGELWATFALYWAVAGAYDLQKRALTRV